MSIAEQLPPMSKHLGIARLGIGGSPLVDVIFDTTDSNKNHPVFGTIVYDQDAEKILNFMIKAYSYDFGTIVQAY
jgi:hypothetical protein